jgi:hypothetical protein
MFAVVLWAGFAIGLACAWSRRWHVVLAGGIVLSIASVAAAIGYLGGSVVSLLLAPPRRRRAPRGYGASDRRLGERAYLRIGSVRQHPRGFAIYRLVAFCGER